MHLVETCDGEQVESGKRFVWELVEHSRFQNGKTSGFNSPIPTVLLPFPLAYYFPYPVRERIEGGDWVAGSWSSNAYSNR